MDKEEIQRETLNGLKGYIIKQAHSQSMNEDFTDAVNYVLWEIFRFAENIGVRGVVKDKL